MTENEGRWPFGGTDDADDEDARGAAPTDPASPPLAPWIPGQRREEEPPAEPTAPVEPAPVVGSTPPAEPAPRVDPAPPVEPTFTELISQPAPPSAPPPSPLVEPQLPPPAMQPPPALIPPVFPTSDTTAGAPTSGAPTYPAVPPRIEDVPTEAMPVMNEPLPTEALPASELPNNAATELLRSPAPPGVGDAPIGDDVDHDVLAEVFAESNFREYEPEPLLLPPPAPAPTPASAPAGVGGAGLVPGALPGVAAPGSAAGAAPGATGGVPGDASRASASGVPKPLAWTAGVLAAVLLLIGLFFLGTRIPEWTTSDAAPAPTTDAAPMPVPEPAPLPDPLEGVPDGVPLPAGDWEWSLLRGGECIEPWVSPWESEFTVVDCAEPHAAQLVLRSPIADAPEEYPGAEAIAAPLALQCSSPQVIDYALAAEYDDIQIQTAYPVTAEEWADGYRDFFCFISRSSGEPLAGDLSLADTAE